MADGKVKTRQSLSIFPPRGSLHRGVALGEGSVLAGHHVVPGAGLDAHLGWFPQLQRESLANVWVAADTVGRDVPVLPILTFEVDLALIYPLHLDGLVGRLVALQLDTASRLVANKALVAFQDQDWSVYQIKIVFGVRFQALAVGVQMARFLVADVFPYKYNNWTRLLAVDSGW